MVSQKEVISLIKQIHFVNPNLNLKEQDVNNILYKLKKSQPELSILSELPFFWYTEGPQSDILSNAIKVMHRDGIIDTIEPYLLFADRTLPDAYPINRDFDNVLCLMLKDFNKDNFCKLTLETFQNAPYRFMYSFKIDYLWKLTFNIRERKKEPILYDECFNQFEHHNLDDIKDAIYRSEIDFPQEPLLDTFDELFSRFVTTSVRVFDYIQNYEEDLPLLTNVFNISLFDIWGMFAKGVRILKHEPKHYYDNMLNQWELEYYESLNNLKFKIDQLKSDVLAKTRYKRISRRQDEKQRKILASIADAYFS
jgi:hypothetical protein